MKDQLDKIAELSHIEISEKEKEVIFSQVQNILKYFHHLAELDTTAINPLISPMEEPLVFREDGSYPIEDSDQLIKQAPSTDGKYIKVPSVVKY